jgi:F-type H+-transporting ATPase subunit epsilon
MLKFKLVTLSGIKSSNDVHEVLLPTPQGQIAVFEHHSPLVSLASTGVIKVRQKAGDPDDFMDIYATNGGVIEIANNTVKVLVDEADAPEEINQQEAEKAHQEAKNLLKDAKDQMSLDHAQTMLDRTSVRLKVAELKNRRKRR